MSGTHHNHRHALRIRRTPSGEVLMSVALVETPRAAGPRHRWFIYVAVAFFGGLLTFAGARAQQKASDDATFRKLIDGYCAAWSSGNPANAAKYYAQDSGSVFYDLAPFQYNGWKEYAAGAQKEFLDSAANISLTAGKELKSTRRGNVPWHFFPIHLLDQPQDGKSTTL